MEKSRSKLEKVRKGGKKEIVVDELTDEEREAVTIVFHQFETGLREGTILVKVLLDSSKNSKRGENLYLKDVLSAMKALGLNPGEQEMIDMTNEVAVNGLVYFPDFCRLVTRKYREDSRELLNQAFFKVNPDFDMMRQIACFSL